MSQCVVFTDVGSRQYIVFTDVAPRVVLLINVLYLQMLHPELTCESVWLTEDMTCKLTGFVTKEDAQERIKLEVQKVSVLWMNLNINSFIKYILNLGFGQRSHYHY